MQPQRLPESPTEGKPKPKKSPRIRSLDGMRFFVQVWIILGHYWFGRDDNTIYLHRFVSRGGIGVTFYIVLSGFMTYIGFKNKPIKEYYSRRIIPMLALNNFAQLISINSLAAFRSINFWMTAIMCTSAYGVHPQLNGPLWTLSTLFFCWLLFPLFRYGVSNASQKTRAMALPFLLICAGLPWIIAEGYAGWVRKFPLFRMLDFCLAMTCASLVKEKYSFRSDFSWMWLYSSDIAIFTVVALGALIPCNEDSCRSPILYKMLEGPIGMFLWLVCIYGFFYKPEQKQVGLTRRMFNHPAVLQLSKGGTTFCAYCMQDPVFHWLSDHPICYLLALWTLAILVNDYLFMPLSTMIRKWFVVVPQIPAPENADSLVVIDNLAEKRGPSLKRHSSNSNPPRFRTEHSAPLIEETDEDNFPAIISRENIILND